MTNRKFNIGERVEWKCQAGVEQGTIVDAFDNGTYMLQMDFNGQVVHLTGTKGVYPAPKSWPRLAWLITNVFCPLIFCAMAIAALAVAFGYRGFALSVGVANLVLWSLCYVGIRIAIPKYER